MFKVIFDTNIWISFLIGKTFKNLIDLIFDGPLIILTSDEQIDEITKVVRRPKFKKYFSTKDVNELLFIINGIVQKVSIIEKVEICRDKKDNFILDIGINGTADYLVTGDIDLLELKNIRGINIIRYKEFEELILRNQKVTISSRRLDEMI